MQIEKYQLWIFRTPIEQGAVEQFEKVFSFWDRIWTSVYSEIGRKEELASDQLTRQHEVMALFLGDRPIATVCHRFADLSADSTLRDSYFKTAWTQKEIRQLRETGGRVCIGSQIMVDPEFRKSISGLPIKHLISFLSLAHAQTLPVDVVLGAMRVDKGMDKVFYEAGAETLAARVPYFNAEVDLVAFYPQKKPIRIPIAFQADVAILLKQAKRIDSFHLPNSQKRTAA